jgi:hypothetical protein
MLRTSETDMSKLTRINLDNLFVLIRVILGKNMTEKTVAMVNCGPAER